MKGIRALPNCLTLLGLLLGTLSLFYAADGALEIAAALIIAAAIADSLDGELARLLKCESVFGERLDSYGDTVCFGAAPALLVYQATKGEIREVSIVLGITILLAGIYRFSRLPLSHPFRVSRHTFRGLPIPVGAVWIALFVLFSGEGFLSSGVLSLTQGLPAILMWLCTIAFLLLQISEVRYTKPSKPILCSSIMIMLVVSMLTLNPGQTAGVLTCVAIVFYVFGTPLLTHQGAEEYAKEMDVQGLHDNYNEPNEDEPLSVNR